MRINEIPKYLFLCVILTVLSELFLAFILGIRKHKDILNIILVNIFTNLIFNSIIILVNIYGSLSLRNILVYILEIVIVLSEGFIYKKVLIYKKINSYLLSLILNAFSYILGLIIF